MKELIDEFKIHNEELIEKTNANIYTKLMEPEIRFSRKNMRSVLHNLLSNAIKYRTPDKSPEILVKTEKKDEYVILSVKDNGLGIKHEHIDKIFMMFKRMYDHVEGTGVGLYIVKRIIDNADGKIEVESEPGKGSTFRIFIKEKK